MQTPFFILKNFARAYKLIFFFVLMKDFLFLAERFHNIQSRVPSCQRNDRNILEPVHESGQCLVLQKIIKASHSALQVNTKFYLMRYSCVVIILFKRVCISESFISVLLKNNCFVFLYFLSALCFLCCPFYKLKAYAC